jgi:hypothetical protein
MKPIVGKVIYNSYIAILIVSLTAQLNRKEGLNRHFLLAQKFKVASHKSMTGWCILKI